MVVDGTLPQQARRAVRVTNQAGVARGYFPETVVQQVMGELQEAMVAGGAHFDGTYVCMHHPTVGEPRYRKDCDCRKPRPGMLKRAESELGADLSRSWVVGDRRSDLQTAWSVGARGGMVKTGYGLGVAHATHRRAGGDGVCFSAGPVGTKRCVGGAGASGGGP